jgi:hypothetical protein
MWRYAVVILMVGCAGCSAVIRPPAVRPAADTVPVLVADYGYHSTIILPRPNGGGMIEYAYGDWTYFGCNQKSLATAFHALLASDQATLGRRVLDREPNQPGLKEAIGANAILTFRAPREKVEDLERSLEERFSRHLETIVYSPVHQLYFVKDGEHYGVAHNCNHFTAEFLQRLGCRIDGVVLMSNFRLAEGTPGEDRAPGAEAHSTEARSTEARPMMMGNASRPATATTTRYR